MNQKLPKSRRKYIRRQKAKIRREVFDLAEQERALEALYQKVFKGNEVNKDKEVTKDQGE